MQAQVEKELFCGCLYTLWPHTDHMVTCSWKRKVAHYNKWLPWLQSHTNTSTPPTPKALPTNKHNADGPNNDQCHLDHQVCFFCLILFLLLIILFLVSYLLQKMLPSHHATHLGPHHTPLMPYITAVSLCSQGGNGSHFWMMSHHCHITSTTNPHMSHCS